MERRPIGQRSEEFFISRGSVEIHPPNIAVDYSLEKCDGAKVTKLVADRSNFDPGKALEQLNIVSQFLLYAVQDELPQTTIAVMPFTTSAKKTEIAESVTGYLKQEVTERHGFRLSEDSGRANADYTIEGNISVVKDAVRATIFIRSAESAEHRYPVDASGSPKDLDGFQRQVAERAFGALSDMRIAQRFGWTQHLSGMDAKALVVDGKRLLCLDEPRPCHRDAGAAVRVLLAAREKSPEDWSVLYYLGKAPAANSKYSDAIESLTSALNHIPASTPRDPGANQALTKIHSDLGDLYVRYGDVKKAVLQYDDSLSVDPNQAEVYTKKAEVLFLSNPPEAMAVLLDGVQRMPAADRLHSALRESISRLREPDFEAVATRFEAASAAGAPVADEYALVCFQRGINSLGNEQAARKYLAKALDLGPKDPEVAAKIYGLGAAISLPTDIAQADKFLSQAETQPQDKLAPGTRNWIARLRAAYFFDQRKYPEAYDWAEKARGIDANADSNLFSAQVAVNWGEELQKADPRNGKASELYTNARLLVRPLVDERYGGADSVYAHANHGLDRDQESHQILRDILKANPQDLAALESLMFVCAEYIFDFDCSYSHAKKLFSLSGDDPGLQLDAVEAAVLKRDYQQASVWLDPLLARPDLDTNYRVVANFYKFWISLARKQTTVTDDFNHLVQSLTAYTSSHPQSPNMIWSFRGARTALTQSGLSEPKQQLLRDVISVFDEPSRGVASIKLPPEA